MNSIPNLLAGWVCLCAGGLSGAALGLCFHRESWLGGYGSFRRRLLRLGHISFFGLGLLNILFALTCTQARVESAAASWLLLIGAVTMPTFCFLTAWRPAFRHGFVLPASSVILGLSLFIVRLL